MKKTIYLLIILFSVVKARGQTIVPSGPLTFCEGGNVTLSISPPPPGSYQWTKDGVATGAGLNTLNVNSSGKYTVIITNAGKRDTLKQVVVTVNPIPAIPNFTFTADGQCANLPFNFIASTPQTGSTYTWDFGDGDSAVGTNVNHIFNAIGNLTQNYLVRVTIKSAAGCSSISAAQTVKTKQKPSASVADFTNNPAFTRCSSQGSTPEFVLNVTNNSTTTNTNTLYEITWGDKKTSFSNSNFPAAGIPHTYDSLGYFTITNKVTGQNGCQNTETFLVYNGSNPGVGLSSSGSTIQQCIPATDTFYIDAVSAKKNPPGTTYTVSFNDGSPNIVYSHPPPAYFLHTFNSSSCNASGAINPNSFYVRIRAQNPCGFLDGGVEPITTITPPQANFDIAPDSLVCLGSLVNLSNTSISGGFVTNSVCDDATIINWSITPSTGWTITSGSLGVSNPDNNPANWGSQDLGVKFNTPGTYTVKLVARNNSIPGTPCRVDSIKKNICVTVPPTPGFTLNNTTGCGPFTVAATNTTTSLNSCKQPTYDWSVTYAPGFCGTDSSWSFAAGSTASSANPSFVFKTAGSYTIHLSVTNACGTFNSEKVVSVKKAPSVGIQLPSYPCGPISITPVATDTSCATSTPTYAWTFAGGIPASSSSKNPGLVSFAATGTHAIALSVTNECGTTTASEKVTVTTAPDVKVPTDQNKCGGESTGPFSFSSTIGTPEYHWTNTNPSIGLPASGTGNIPVFTAINNGATAITALIIVTPVVSADCSGQPDTFAVTVNPQPTAPRAIASPVTYCLRATAIPLSATGTGNNALTWYANANLTGGFPTAPTPSTATAGTTTFYVTQANSGGCKSPADSITVVVNPAIAGNLVTADQNLCAQVVPTPLTTQTAIGGGTGSFGFLWQSSGDGGLTWTTISGASGESYSPPALSSTVKYRRVVSSATCSDTSNIITITVQGALSNYQIAASQVICEGFVPLPLTGQIPTGGGGSYKYTWEMSADNLIWLPTGAATPDFQPPALLQTTFFRRRIDASQCSATSLPVTISVNAKPAGDITAATSPICAYDAGQVVFNATAGKAPFNIQLHVTGPNGTDAVITQPVSNNGPLTITALPPNSLPGNYNISLIQINDANTCSRSGTIATVTLVVKPKPKLVTSGPATICAGNSTPISVSGGTEYTWSPAAGLDTTAGNAVKANPVSSTTYLITGTNDGCSDTVSVRVTVTPGSTIAATAPAQVLCNVTSASLAANQAQVGTGSWRQTLGPATTIADASKNNTTVSGLVAGQRYVFTWTITGLPPCPATSANDTLDVLTPIVNEIQNDTIVCSGQPVMLRTKNLSGGSTNGLAAQFSFQWEFATPGQNNWQNLPGANGDTLLISPTTSTCYRRKAKSNNACETASSEVCITVNPAIGNNVITGDAQVCVNMLPGVITGTTVTGGDNNYVYQWQTGTDGQNWTTIANTSSYQPPIYAVADTHYFRRNISSGNCISASNAIALIVRPDSKALFTASPLVSCAPFDLSKAISVTPLPDSNGNYFWYANGALLGSNSTGAFPGDTIYNPADTVLIKLRTTSLYGCKADSIQAQFITPVTAIAKFSKGKSTGCGPLLVPFTNISSLVNDIQFFWDFGNGQTSTAAQPGAIEFASSPFFNDTTYYVTLKAYNGCDTTLWKDSVQVRANPKARFGVDTTFGCSPFKVTIDNTSPGGPSTYYWDFGDGKKDTTLVNSIFEHRYNIGNAVDTFTIRLIAANECARDTESINIRVAPNPIRPLINVSSSELFGCSSHTVTFNNNTSGASGFTWDFGDNTPIIVTNNNQSEVEHTFDSAGVFTVSVDITNGCSDTTVYREITVYPKPLANFRLNGNLFCAGDTVVATNLSKDATNYRWFWGDGSSNTTTDGVHVYTVPGNYDVVLRAERTNDAGLVCFDTLSKPITVLARPVVTVQSNIRQVNCAPFTLNVSAPGLSNETPTWYFYDSAANPVITTLHDISAQYTFFKPGTFYVKLVAQNARNCADSTLIPFTVQGNALASFTPGDLAVCNTDTTINYINTSTYDGTDAINYRWLVDDALVATSANFTHRYTAPPNTLLPKIFTTSLVVSNSVGCTDTASAALQLNPLAKAQFSITNGNACAPFQLAISNASVFTTQYRWLVNGVLASSDAAPVIIITKGSTGYSVSLIADNIYGCKPDTFTVNFTSRAKPTAVFSLSDTLGCTGQLNVATTNLTTAASSYSWNWGDGTPNSAFNSPTHLYNTPGQYRITLVASDGVCTDTTSQLVKVSIKPTVDFSVDQTITCGESQVQFINLSSNATGYEWSFGDGSSSEAVNPSKLFLPRVIPYTVKLVATSTLGCRDSLVKPNLITAKVPPGADFLISPSPVITVPNYTFSFNNVTLDNPNYKYLWSLGDGNFSETRDVTHKYADTGNYPVRLIVLDTVNNCIDSITRIARVDGFPGYLYVPNAICPNCIEAGTRQFLPKGMGLKEYRLQIFTTWNELIFETRALDSKGTPTQAWDGKFKGNLVQQDVYVWRIDAKFLNGSEWNGMIYPGEGKYKKVGTITVIK